MTVRLLAFTQKGMELARRLAAELSGEAARCGEGCTLDAWTADAFANADALVYVGAAGIAVRAVAPYAGNKASDPAVVAVDECGRFAVPLLSGHLGGANRLARRIGAVCGALPVITTATDANGAFAVDEWAVRQGCCVLDVPRIKRVSAKILAGGTAVLRSPWPVAGTPPAGVAADGGAFDFELTVHSADAGALRLVPRIAVLGVGCRRGIGQQAMEEAFAALLAQSGLCAEAFYKVCSIDLKRDEPGPARVLRGPRLCVRDVFRRTACSGGGPLFVVRLCAERDGRGQRVRAQRGAGQRRDIVLQKTGGRRRDHGGGHGALRPGLAVAG